MATHCADRRFSKPLGMATIAILVSVFVIGLAYYLPQTLQNEQPIEVVVTSFNVKFIYTGETAGYFKLLSNAYECSMSNSTTTYTATSMMVL